MKGFFAAIYLAATLGATPAVVQESPVDTHHDHVHSVEACYVARATMFKAVCSKGDLNATFSSRSDAVKAAQKHQKSTGHKTSVQKQ